MNDKVAVAAAATVLVILIGGGAWVPTSAPGGLWKYSPIKDVPARCVIK